MKEAGVNSPLVWFVISYEGLAPRARHLGRPQGENQMRTDDADATARLTPLSTHSLWGDRGRVCLAPAGCGRLIKVEGGARMESWTRKTCARCFKETLQPAGPYVSTLTPPLIDADQYWLYACPCGFQCARKQDFRPTLDPRYTKPVDSGPTDSLGQWDE